MSISKLLIISNRLPINVTKVDGKLAFTPSNGGLATAMSSLGGTVPNQLWIGWPGIATEELTPADQATITTTLREQGCYPVFLNKEQIKNFYEGYANNTIWPLFHYFQSIALYNDEYWTAYKEVNQIFKKAVLKHADEHTSIWIHDYHLMLLPNLLRARLPKNSIGFFMHIPFPSFEIFRLLPNRREILEGLLGADLVGFHVYDYARHFLSSVLRLFGYEQHHGSIAVDGRVVKVDAFPIGIDYRKFKTMLKDPGVQREIKLLDDYYNGYKIILSMDRLDYSKGILSRLEAFELFLKENPKYLKKVVLVMVAVPSRTEVEAYKALREDIESMISHINGAYATVDWTPISYQFRNLPFEQILALHAKADIALVTPLRDGMNLVAKEFIAAKQKRTGVLILSEMAGAIDELPEALDINPNDKRSVARAIKQALQMSKKEQQRRLTSMQRRLSGYSVQRWAADFIDQLELTKRAQAKRNKKVLTGERQQQLVQGFRSAQKRLLYLDYDGTLHDFVESPNLRRALPSRKLLGLLKMLTDIPNTTVCIVSGRPKEALDAWFSQLPVSLVAEHGAWTKENGTWERSKAEFQVHKRRLLPLLEHFAERTPGAAIEEKTSSFVWHYRNVPTELAYVRNLSLRHELSQLLAGTNMEVFAGSKILEIKPRMIHKGRVVRDFLIAHPADFVMAIGDDHTDEDMFEALPDSVSTIKVGLGETRARYQVASVEKAHGLLRALAEPES
jgi:trehalose 6-phosphate synthase/phosphatase